MDEPTEGPRVRDEFFMKLVLAPLTGIADRMGADQPHSAVTTSR
ncbi:hypothetical protein [Nonomuraea dietziae]